MLALCQSRPILRCAELMRHALSVVRELCSNVDLFLGIQTASGPIFRPNQAGVFLLNDILRLVLCDGGHHV